MAEFKETKFTSSQIRNIVESNIIRKATSIPFRSYTPVTQENNEAIDNVVFSEGDEPVGTTVFGGVVYSNLFFPEDSYEDDNGDIITYAAGDFIVNEVAFTVTTANKIIKTEVTGLSGSVKEFISNKDHEITAQGLLVSDDGNIPREKIRQLNLIAQAPQSVQIISNYLAEFGIKNVVINSVNTRQIEGNRGVVGFSISMTEDTPIELELLNEDF